MHRRTTIIMTAAIAALGAGACGGADEDGARRSAPVARELDPSEPLLLTTAARRLGEARLHLLVPRFPACSAECARALTEVVVGLNLRAAEAPPPG